MQSLTSLPTLICGPILRRVESQSFSIWWVTTSNIDCTVQLFTADDSMTVEEFSSNQPSVQYHRYPVGTNAYIHHFSANISAPLIENTLYLYDVISSDDAKSLLNNDEPSLSYTDDYRPSFSYIPTIKSLLHGSCRNPQHGSMDGLVCGDLTLKSAFDDSSVDKPSCLLLTGDQIYADHVTGYLLQAIHRLINVLGLFDECLPATTISKASQLTEETEYYYLRQTLLPKTELSHQRFFKSSCNPIFTSAHGDNHLMSLSEHIAMYFLVWSPAPWGLLGELDDISQHIPTIHSKQYLKERQNIVDFVATLPRVRRLLASIPTYMMFDDHDVTDDWNITELWEKEATKNPLSKQIIGNALISYWLCQGWGNDPFRENTTAIATQLQSLAELATPQELPTPDNATNQHNSVASATKSPLITANQHHELLNAIYAHPQWHYEIHTSPHIVVLDTRTNRWHSTYSSKHPSGLMDWESLCDIQQKILDEDSVILVSPAPIFGVKFIEMLQRVATWLGFSLHIDAENWMGHRGCAKTLLQIFKHRKTPSNFTILSGDVHYSFVYDIRLRFKTRSPKIWQITCSGIKNQFPEPLLSLLSRLNVLFFGRYSPLNVFTRRRKMSIRERRYKDPSGEISNSPLLNHSALGYVVFNEAGAPAEIKALLPDTNKGELNTIEIEFVRKP